ncbi:MAG TPA: hypothetical protein DEH25_05250 [Chloroflexi bacterium]|nr:hypothetical protein [Chloroflexota bacterium]
MERQRKPRLNQKFKEVPVSLDWLPPNDFSLALKKPNQQRQATTYKLEFSQIHWQSFIPAILLLFVVLAGQIWLSDVNFRPFPAETALLEVVLNHKAGYPLRETATTLEPELGLTSPTRLILEIDGQTQWDQSYQPQGKDGRVVAFEQTQFDPGEHHLRLTMFDRPGQLEGQILFDELVLFENHGILDLSFSDAPLQSDPVAGRKLFFESSLEASASCHVCHSIEPGEVVVGPSLAGVATRAAERVPGLNAEDYLRESILHPDAYVVEGFPAGQMLPDLGKKLSSDQIDNLVAFLLTLK